MKSVRLHGRGREGRLDEDVRTKRDVRCEGMSESTRREGHVSPCTCRWRQKGLLVWSCTAPGVTTTVSASASSLPFFSPFTPSAGPRKEQSPPLWSSIIYMLMKNPWKGVLPFLPPLANIIPRLWSNLLGLDDVTQITAVKRKARNEEIYFILDGNQSRNPGISEKEIQ